jgi:enamine deaminase RidA (YjgF/YER057c/UK114 family)
MRRQVVHTPKVPPARVPLSQAIKVGDWVFASGQLGLDVSTGKLAEGGIAAETRRACENLKAVLEAAGSSPDRVVKVALGLNSRIVDELASNSACPGSSGENLHADAGAPSKKGARIHCRMPASRGR